MAALETVRKVGHMPTDNLPYGKWKAIGQLDVWDENPRRRAKKDSRYKLLLETMPTYGQVQPIVIQEDGSCCPLIKVLDGNRRLMVADELGWKAIWVVETDPDVDAGFVAGLINSTMRPWEGPDMIQFMAHDPDREALLSPYTRRNLAILRQSLTWDETMQFSSVYGTRAIYTAKRVAEYAGIAIGDVARYILQPQHEALRDMEFAMRFHIPAESLKAVIMDGAALKVGW